MVSLARYRPQGAVETADVARVRELTDSSSNPWARSAPLHLTASALVVHPPSARVLLRWHPRMQSWLQIGGHADPGETDPVGIVLREGEEETGLADLKPWPDDAVVHVVIVSVPASHTEPAHQHADLRFVLATDQPDDARPEHPEAPLRWLSLPDARALTVEANLHETLLRAERLLTG